MPGSSEVALEGRRGPGPLAQLQPGVDQGQQPLAVGGLELDDLLELLRHGAQVGLGLDSRLGQVAQKLGQHAPGVGALGRQAHAFLGGLEGLLGPAQLAQQPGDVGLDHTGAGIVALRLAQLLQGLLGPAGLEREAVVVVGLGLVGAGLTGSGLGRRSGQQQRHERDGRNHECSRSPSQGRSAGIC